MMKKIYSLIKRENKGGLEDFETPQYKRKIDIFCLP